MTDGKPDDVSVHDEVVRSYYPALLTAGSAARGRAQVAFCVSSAAAAALVVAGAFGDPSERSTGVQILGLAALAAWLTAAGLFLWAMASPVKTKFEGESRPEAFVGAVLANAEQERDVVYKRQQLALGAVVVALAATLGGLVALVRDEEDSPAERPPIVTVLLTNAGYRAASTVCHGLKNPFTARVDASKLNGPFVLLGGARCGAQRLRLRVPSSDVIAVSRPF